MIKSAGSVRLSMDLAEYLIEKVVSEIFSDFDEPIPPFSERFEGKLESCINQPFQSFSGRDLYPTLVSKSSVLFYLVIKNHPLKNGNKRSAIVLMLGYLFLNGFWLNADQNGLYKITIYVAESPMEDKDTVIKALEKFFSKFMVRAEEVFGGNIE